MYVYHYPEDYLSKRGSIKHCWDIHVKRMKEIGQPYVDYNSFYIRLKKWNWDLYKAIHTPLDCTRMSNKDKIKIWCRTLRYRFIYLFRPNDKRNRGRRSKGHEHSR